MDRQPAVIELSVAFKLCSKDFFFSNKQFISLERTIYIPFSNSLLWKEEDKGGKRMPKSERKVHIRNKGSSDKNLF